MKTCLFLIVLMSVPYLPSQVIADSKMPNFSEYPALSSVTAVLESIDLTSHEKAKMFRTHLKRLVGQRPNFAGKYVVSAIGCGTECQMPVMVDTDTGRVKFPDLITRAGFCIDAESNLFIADPIPLDEEQPVADWQRMEFFYWDGHDFNFIKESKYALSYDCLENSDLF